MRACLLIAVLGTFSCIMRIKSDVTEILEDTMGRDTREEKINIMMAAMEELNMYASEEGVGQFIDIQVPTAYADLTLNTFGLIAFFCVMFGAKKRYEKLMIPALVFIPIDFLKCTIFVILFAIPLGFSNPFTITLTVINLLNALIYVPEWIAIYSLRHEILENDDTSHHAVAFSDLCDHELAHQQQG